MKYNDVVLQGRDDCETGCILYLDLDDDTDETNDGVIV